ncbi:helix-hairpin-helix domain-containing protein [Microvirga sp. CF3016]|uniref:helix-hairpin-helix domain-containing protein n=1 Tax=Microvirga sp. CF3016 TaxID=3110181 RepID=UPI002E781A59|nr:helix-hairpin-helix domain-containing protein [Microvirga sp. CF3016]MEE1610378.1 helix-hairpin-helix domain-containing protein [Microvirga sp. CF3016]
MQVGELSRTQAPREPRDNAALQAMRILLVVGLMSAGWLALWRAQGGGPATEEGMVTVAPPQTITVEPRAATPPDRADPVQVADADPSAPTALPVRRPAAPAPEPDEDELELSAVEPGIDPASIGASRDQSLAVLKQFEAVVQQSSAGKPAKPLPEAPADMNVTGTVKQQASRADSFVPAGDPEPTLVDLNKGTIEQLNRLKGASSLGRAIVRGRPYKSVEDLVTKRVVRRTAFERIKDQVTVQ